MRVFNVPASAPFLRTVIAALVDGGLIDGFNARANPERLAEATLYLPTRRAGRMTREIFLDVLGMDAVILPRIVILGAIDDDEASFADQDIRGAFDIPAAFGELERRLLLARMIDTWAKGIKPDDPHQSPLVVGGPASTLALAGDLARLMDDMVTRKVEWPAFDRLVPDALDQYWQYTLRFLNVAKEVWPEILRVHDRIEPMARTNRLIEAEARRLVAQHRGPVIAAGSTGSRPSSAELLHVIAGLPQGAVVLPGLDTDLDDKAWQLIGGAEDEHGRISAAASNHPQFAMHGLLDRFGLKRGDVQPLGTPAPHGRELLMSEAMRPSNATAQWHRRLGEPEVIRRISAGMKDLAIIEAANSEMEALAIAVAMREAHEADKSAALVTPDRALARRVTAALARWDLVFDDSGGDALMDTSAGIFARLAAEAASRRLEPPTLLALLKHPLLRLGGAQDQFRGAIQTLELALLRGTRPMAGSKGLAKDFACFRDELTKLRQHHASTLHYAEPRSKLNDIDLDQAQALIVRLQEVLAPLESIDASKSHDFSELARLHRDVLMALSRNENETKVAFEGPQGLALSKAFDDLLGIVAQDGTPRSGLMVLPSDYPEVFQTAFADHTVRRPEAANVQLRVYGQLEARLTHCDRVILGGLVEGVWPPAPRNDPWLSRPMRHELRLDLPERRVGLSAHDFAQLLGADDVILSHAAKVGGAPSVASRFLHRLEAVAGEARWDAAKARGKIYLDYADELDRPLKVEPIPQPMPKPPRAARPLKLSVTAIEDWLRDPYTIYAKHILKLAPLDPVDMPLSAADRGSAIHDALGDFTQAWKTALPDDPVRALRQTGEKHFAPLMERPEAQALWWPRYLRIASWFAGWESERRLNVKTIDAEVEGKISIRLDNERSFILSARADRIEHRTDRSFAILDYKTGAPPTGKQVRMGLSPQLTLEAAILREGGFANIAAGSSVSELLYVRLSGNNPPGKSILLELKVNKSDPPQSPDEAADEARRKLETLIRAFDNEDQAYTSLSLSMWSNRYGDYDDLARIKEWSAAGGFGEELE